jgi:AraC-like DNA-binding protein
MIFTRTPKPAMRPFVKQLWASDAANPTPGEETEKERVLPTGMMHLVFRISDQPLRIFDSIQDQQGRTLGDAIVGGARSSFYVREFSEPSVSVGAQLLPGASELLFGVHADELAGRHTALDELWGRDASLAKELIFECGSPEQRMDGLEALLSARLPKVRGLHPAVAHALEQFMTTSDVREVVRQTGYSHRRFIALFGRAVGLTPKLYCRVLRFQRVLDLSTSSCESLVDLALEAGYSDQSHFNRQFREFSGLTPGEYHRMSVRNPNHVPILRRRP